MSQRCLVSRAAFNQPTFAYHTCSLRTIFRLFLRIVRATTERRPFVYYATWCDLCANFRCGIRHKKKNFFSPK